MTKKKYTTSGSVPVSSGLSLATLIKNMPGSTTEHIGLINIHLSASTSLRLLASLPPDTDTSHIYQTQICSPTFPAVNSTLCSGKRAHFLINLGGMVFYVHLKKKKKNVSSPSSSHYQGKIDINFTLTRGINCNIMLCKLSRFLISCIFS